MILCWEKPEKITGENLRYTPNMNHKDMIKWKAKIYKKAKRVEIRTSLGGSQLLVVVSIDGFNERIRGKSNITNVKMSSNGPNFFTFEDFKILQLAVEEAKVELEKLNEQIDCCP